MSRRTKRKFKKFTRKEDEVLLNFIKKYPALYDVNDPLYKKMPMKVKLWKEVSERLKRSVNDCKTRWRHMRDYSMRLKNHPRSVESKCGELLRRLSFLHTDDHQKQTISSTNGVSLFPEVYTDNYMSPRSSPLLVIEKINDEDPINTTVSSSISNYSKSDEQHCGEGDFGGHAVSRHIRVKQSKFNKDELSLFFETMESATRKLPPYLQLKIKRGVADIIYSAEGEHLSAQDSFIQL